MNLMNPTNPINPKSETLQSPNLNSNSSNNLGKTCVIPPVDRAPWGRDLILNLKPLKL